MDRFVAIAAAIVALYSLFEIGASVWEISRGATVFPEVVQVWFDFSHDQVLIFPFPIFLFSFSGFFLRNCLLHKEIGDRKRKKRERRETVNGIILLD